MGKTLTGIRTTMLENFRGSRKSSAVFSLYLQMLMLKIILAQSMATSASAGHHLGKIPLFPPLPKGDERGIFFAAFAPPDPSFRRKPESRGGPGQALREIFRFFWLRRRRAGPRRDATSGENTTVSQSASFRTKEHGNVALGNVEPARPASKNPRHFFPAGLTIHNRLIL
jgi:hypothetical protein